MPEDRVEITAYVNAYSVTRHYGGPEEGGWWYNAGAPLASIPIRATVKLHEAVRDEEGYPDCAGCVEGRNPACPDNEIAFNEADAALARSWLESQLAGEAHGNIYSVRGGAELQIRKETCPAQPWPARRPHYE